MVNSNKEEEDTTNSTNNLKLFYTRALVQGKVCSVKINERSCANVASEYMVKKLGLKVKKHPWLDEKYKLRVDSKVMVPITIGKYKDEILCDVLPMDSCHILLGKPWQSDRKATHDGFTNRHSFKFKGRKHVLIPLTPQEAYQDQIIIKERVKQFVSESLNPLHHKENVLVADSKETPMSLTNIAPELPSPSDSSFLLQESKNTAVDPEKSPPTCEEEPQEESPTEQQRSPSLVNDLEQQTYFVREPVFMPFPFDYPRKHCKEIDLVRTEPNMFILVSAQEEKCFGLEGVKEFCVSKSVFDKMFPNFETISFEKFFKPKCFLFESSLRVSLSNNAFELFRTEIESALVRTCPNLNHLLENMFCGSNSVSELCKPILKDHLADFSFSKIISFSKLSHLFFAMSVEKGT